MSAKKKPKNQNNNESSGGAFQREVRSLFDPTQWGREEQVEENNETGDKKSDK